MQSELQDRNLGELILHYLIRLEKFESTSEEHVAVVAKILGTVMDIYDAIGMESKVGLIADRWLER